MLGERRRLRRALKTLGLRTKADLVALDEHSLAVLNEYLGDEISKLRERVRDEFPAVNPVKSSLIKRKYRKFSSGVEGLDRLLGGGFEAGSITELIGEYGTGKTQLCHQAAVMALAEEGARTLYIDAEGTFRPERIIQIAEAKGVEPEDALDNIIYFRAISSEKLLEAIYAARTLANNLNLGLLVVDCVTCLPYAEFPGKENIYVRRRRVWDIMRGLKTITAKNIAVLVTNRAVSYTHLTLPTTERV